MKKNYQEPSTEMVTLRTANILESSDIHTGGKGEFDSKQRGRASESIINSFDVTDADEDLDE